MSDTELSALIGQIYDTTFDPDRWPGVLANIVGFMDGKTGALVSQGVGGKHVNFHYSWGEDPKYTELYRTTYARLNPAVVPVALSVKSGEICSLSMMIPFGEFLKSRFYKEWAQPQGYGDVTTVIIEKAADGFAHLGVSYDLANSPVGDELRRKMALLAPHVCRAVAISKLVELSKIEAALLADTVDSLDAAVFLVREDGRLGHANGSGRALLAQGVLFRENNGVISAVNPEARAAVSASLAAAASGDAGMTNRKVAIPLTSRDGERYVCHIMSLAAGARSGARARYDTAVAMFVHKASVERPTMIEAVAAHFKLTPAELRVMFAIIEVGGTPEVAKMLGTSIDTVKTHLKRIFAKTETRRQADLVKLVVGYMNPLI